MTNDKAPVTSALFKCPASCVRAFIMVVTVLPVVMVSPFVPLRAAFANDPLLVVVRKRAEPEKSVPQTVQVFRAREINAMRLQSPTDLSALVSGFSFNDPFGRYNPAPSMRGLIQPGLGDEPSVGFFNDGLYLSGRSSINALAFDLARIETAKGPQNALYGRNSFGGAINAISALPGRETERSIDVTYGQKNRKQVTAVASGPVTDTLSARLALYGRDWGGYFKNSVPGGPDLGREQTAAARLTLRLTPTPERDIVLRVTHLHDRDSQPKGFLVPANCAPRVVGAPALRYYCGELPEGRAPYGANPGHDGYERLHTRVGLDWNETISDTLSAALTLGGSTENSEFSRDDDYSGTQAARAGVDTRRYDLQADGRLMYKPQSRAWSLLGGVSLYRFSNFTHRQDQYYVLGQVRPQGPIAKGMTDTASVYGSLALPLQQNFTLTLDGRYQREWKTLESDIRNLAGNTLDLDGGWTAFTPKITLSWQEKPGSLLAYVSAAKGYKSGGFNDRANIFDAERTFGPETNWTYEAGLKNIPLRENLALDFGGFYIDWQNQQVLAYSAAGATNNFFLNNNAQSTVKGIEASLNWRIAPTTRLGMHYTYADARFDRYNDPDLATVQGFAPTGDVSGNRLPRYSPHHLGADIEDRRTFTLLPDAEWVSAAQFSFQSSQYTDNGNLAENGHRALLNLQAGVEVGGAYAGFYVDNALDERDPPVGISWSDARTGFSRAWLVTPQDGRTVGIRMKYKF